MVTECTQSVRQITVCRPHFSLVAVRLFGIHPMRTIDMSGNCRLCVCMCVTYCVEFFSLTTKDSVCRYIFRLLVLVLARSLLYYCVRACMCICVQSRTKHKLQILSLSHGRPSDACSIAYAANHKRQTGRMFIYTEGGANSPWKCVVATSLQCCCKAIEI